MLTAGHLSGSYAALLAATEVCSDDDGTYRAHAKAMFRASEYAPMLDVINPLYLGLPTALCYHPGCYSLGNHRGQQFGPCLSLSQR